MVQTAMSSRFGDFNVSINFHVLDTITKNLPTHINIEQLHIPSVVNCRLADPQFGKPSSVDILIGAEIFFDLFVGKSIKISSHLAFHNTSLGWVLTGSVPIYEQPPSSSLLLHHNSRSALALVSQSNSSSLLVNSHAEAHFKSNVAYDELGRFVVRLPFIQDPLVFGDSRFIAQQRFYNLERKFIRTHRL